MTLFQVFVPTLYQGTIIYFLGEKPPTLNAAITQAQTLHETFNNLPDYDGHYGAAGEVLKTLPTLKFGSNGTAVTEHNAKALLKPNHNFVLCGRLPHTTNYEQQ